ncbi:MAG TPA: PEP/pyruvate-binding domain-containing protein [Thermoleophilaceae bacterium]|nr:PEP/pyruvate-binding domain-containing protein [Thermoleophilaceae bacterium]
MTRVVPLAEAREHSVFGSKAVGLGDAARGGLPVPPGVALSGPVVEAMASGEDGAIKEVAQSVRSLQGPFAVRSSAVGEDGADASFAGQHVTLLNVPSADAVPEAVREIWWSANSDSAITYRQRTGMFVRPSVGVVVQALLDSDVAGVMFTQNPISGADERVIEAAWGLGEAVVAGRVIPDHYRVARSGEVLERTCGTKQLAIRRAPNGGTVEEQLPAVDAERHCLSDEQLAGLHELATRCEDVYGPGRDIEWAYAGGELYLLQCRPVTTGRKAAPRPAAAENAPAEAVQAIPLFAGLTPEQVDDVAQLFKERRFAAGETIIREGSGGAAFFLIDSGEATVSVRGEERARLGPGDAFGELAMIDEGVRSATVAATNDVVCWGLTYWDFRPFVEQNGAIAWNLLQTLAKRLRAAEGDG